MDGGSRNKEEQAMHQAQPHAADVNDPASNQTYEQEVQEEKAEQAPAPALAQALSVEDVMVSVCVCF